MMQKRLTLAIISLLLVGVIAFSVSSSNVSANAFTDWFRGVFGITGHAVFAGSCGDTITGDTELDADLLDCEGDGLIIGADNIVLDCAGHTISGYGGNGIFLSSRNNVTIENCVMTGFQEGIRLESSSNSNIINNAGYIHLLSSSSNNNLSGNSGMIILESGSDNNIITDNNAFGDVGIALHLSSNNIIINNNASSGHSGFGIYIGDSSNNNTLAGNTLTFNVNGIGISDSSDNTLMDNDISYNYRGIHIYSGSNNIIKNNNMDSNGEGILLSSSSNSITGNTVSHNDQFGISVAGDSVDNTIYNNYFNNTNFCRQRECDNPDCHVSKEACENCGCWVTGNDAYAENSANYWNTTYDCSTSTLNIIGGQCIGGNYWSSYYGIDDGSGAYPYNTGGDGIGDTKIPYTNGNVADLLPLTNKIVPNACYCDGCSDCSGKLNDPLCDSVYLTKNIATGNSISVYDLSTQTKTQITVPTFEEYNPVIYGDKIVWQKILMSGHDIYMHDISTSTETQITTDPSDQSNPAIYGNYIVWQDGRNGNLDIYMYGLSTSTETQITNDPNDQYNPAIYGNYIVWQDYRNGAADIYMYDISTSTETQITVDDPELPVDQYNPAIYGNYIVWQDYRNGAADIYMYDISTSTETQITTDSNDQYNPAIYGNYIVWQDSRNGNNDIYMYDLLTSTETQITSDSNEQYNPAIYGNYIIWQDYRNGNADIYMYDLSTSTETQITSGSNDQVNPAIYGDKIIWVEMYPSGQQFGVCINGGVGKTFDCQGYTIEGYGDTNAQSVGVSPAQGITVQNCVIKNFGVAFRKDWGSAWDNDVTVYNNTIIDNGCFGGTGGQSIGGKSSMGDGDNISNNNISNNNKGICGAFIGGGIGGIICGNATIANNYVSNNNFGIFALSGGAGGACGMPPGGMSSDMYYETQIIGNTIVNNVMDGRFIAIAGISFGGAGIIASGGTTHYGDYYSYSTVSIQNNIIKDNTQGILFPGTVSLAGVTLDGRLSIEGNTIQNNDEQGYAMQGMSNPNNLITMRNAGISIGFPGDYMGAFESRGQDITIKDNEISGNGYGMTLSGQCLNCGVEGNTMTGNTGVGVSMEGINVADQNTGETFVYPSAGMLFAGANYSTSSYMSSNYVVNSGVANSNTYGAYLSSSVNNTFAAGNTFLNNAVYDIYMDYYSSIPGNNILDPSNTYGTYYTEPMDCNCSSLTDCRNKLNGICPIVYLVADITECTDPINIDRSGKTFDCQGYTINGDGCYHGGIDRIGGSNTIIKNCVITGFNSGIRFEESDNNIIINNTVSHNQDLGISVMGSNNTITNNTVIGNENTGLQVSGYEGALSSTINSNFVCNNTNYDFYSGDWSTSSGTDNTCGKPDGWNDIGTTGCTYLDSCEVAPPCTDGDGDGYYVEGGECGPVDCNDGSAAIRPGADDSSCNGIDENCDGYADDGYVATPTTCGADFCYAEGALSCINGTVVDTCVPKPPVTVYADNDSDTYGSSTDTQEVCTLPSDYVMDNTDCNDGDASINPAAKDICDINHNVIDKNCNASDDTQSDCRDYCGDIDGDGYVIDTLPADWNGFQSFICNWIKDIGDCNDGDAAINPEATEICDGVDNNCDGKIDEGCPAADKEDALAILQGLYTSDSKSQKELNTAIKELKDSLGNRNAEGDKKIVWIDSAHIACRHGNKVFDHEKRAVEHLEKINDPAITAQVAQAITSIVNADRNLALTAINEAPAGKDKDKAIAKFNKGEAETRNKHKIQEYRKAWKHLNKHCEKPEPGKKQSCIEEMTVQSPAGDLVSAVGDEVGHPETVFTDIYDNQIVIHTSCSKCLYVGQVISGWTITELVEYADQTGTLAAKCAKK